MDNAKQCQASFTSRNLSLPRVDVILLNGFNERSLHC